MDKKCNENNERIKPVSRSIVDQSHLIHGSLDNEPPKAWIEGVGRCLPEGFVRLYRKYTMPSPHCQATFAA